MELPEKPEITLEDGSIYEPPHIPLDTKAKVFSGFAAVSGLATVLAHGGWASLAVGAVVGGVAVLAAPAVAPYVERGKDFFEETKTAIEATINRERVRQRAETASEGIQGDLYLDGSSMIERGEGEAAGGGSNLADLDHMQTVIEQFQEAAEVVPSLTVPSSITITGPFFPGVSWKEILHLGETVHGGQRFDPSMNWLLGEGGIALGVPGSGKTNILAVIYEHANEKGVPSLTFDIKREYISALALAPRGLVVTHPAAVAEMKKQFGVRVEELTEQSAPGIVEAMLKERQQVIVDTQSFILYGGKTGWTEAAKLMRIMLETAFVYSVKQGPGYRLPCLIFVDECHTFFPENPEMKSLFNPDVLASLNVAMLNIVTLGRSFGFTPFLGTQRIASVAKWTLTNCKMKMVMRHTLDIDLDRCIKEVGKAHTNAATLKALPKGRGYVVGITDEPILVQFDTRRTRHDSHTPDLSRLWQLQPEEATLLVGRGEVIDSGFSKRIKYASAQDVERQRRRLARGKTLKNAADALRASEEHSPSQAGGVPPSGPPSQAGGVSPSSGRRAGIPLQPASEAEVKGNEGEGGDGRGDLALSERKKREQMILEMFLRIGTVSGVVKELEGVTSGGGYQKTAAEVSGVLQRSLAARYQQH